MGCGICGCCARVNLIIAAVFAFVIALFDIGFPAYRVIEAPKEYKSIGKVRLSGEVTAPSLSINFFEFSMYAYYGILGGGVILLFLSVFGITSTCKSNRCCLGITAALTALLVGGSIVALVFYMQIYRTFRDNITPSLQESIKLRYNVSGYQDITEAWNIIMDKYSCCGGAGLKDFLNRTEIEDPNEREVNLKEINCEDSSYPPDGCNETMRIYEIDATNTIHLIAFGLQLTFSILLTLLSICACWFTKDKRSKKERKDSYELESRSQKKR